MNIITPGRFLHARLLPHTLHIYLIHSQVNASIGDDAQQTGGETLVETEHPFTLQQLSGTIQQAPVLPCLAQC